MFSIFMVTFREGVEAFLIAAITLTYLYQTGRVQLIKVALAAIGTAVALSVGLGMALVRAGGISPEAEGVLALLAAGLVISCVVHILRHGKQMSADIRSHVIKSEQSSLGAALALFGFMVLMIGREGVETATMIATLVVTGSSEGLLPGALLGTACAAGLAAAWVKFGRHIDLALFFRVTAVFMLLFAVQLVITSVHEFSEGGVLPLVDNELWHEMTEPYGPEGAYGLWFSYGLLLVPLGFLLMGLLRKPVVRSGQQA